MKLPGGEDTNEWVAVNTVFFYNALNVLYSVLDGTLCTDQKCPVMCAGPQVEYLWADGVRVKTPIKVTAPEYVNALFDWVEEQLDDPSLFPRGPGGAFPRDFLAVAKTILKRLFRVYAHLYHCHFKQIISLELEPHLNTCFRHFILFVQVFSKFHQPICHLKTKNKKILVSKLLNLFCPKWKCRNLTLWTPKN